MMSVFPSYCPAAESPQLPLGDECFLPVAGCRVLEWSLRLLPEGLHRQEGLCIRTIENRQNRKELFFINFLIFIYMFLLTCLPGMALSAEDPDVLYEKGRFAEAEKIYTEYDMDHPNDLRYRFNRGCSAYQNGNFEGAAAAFSSVLRRARAENEDSGENSQLLFKTAFNLGNTSFRQGDFQSAAAYYRQALLYDSKSADVKYNLELALREAEKQKNQEKEPDKNSCQDDSQDRNNQEKSENKEEGKGENQPENEADNESKEASEPEKKDESKGADQKIPEQDQSKDLSGDLKPQQDMQSKNGEDQTSTQAVPDKQEKFGIDRKRAAALLDNIKEDPSKLPQFQLRAEAERGVGSGKDW